MLDFKRIETVRCLHKNVSPDKNKLEFLLEDKYTSPVKRIPRPKFSMPTTPEPFKPDNKWNESSKKSSVKRRLTSVDVVKQQELASPRRRETTNELKQHFASSGNLQETATPNTIKTESSPIINLLNLGLNNQLPLGTSTNTRRFSIPNLNLKLAILAIKKENSKLFIKTVKSKSPSDVFWFITFRKQRKRFVGMSVVLISLSINITKKTL